METKEKFDIFISYKRISLPTANNLYYRLTTKGYSTFFDLEEMRNDDFDKQLLHYIGNAKDVFVILEEHSLDACKDGTWETDWFCREIIFALEQKKNIIPMLLNGYEMPKEEDMPDALKRLTKQDARKFEITYFDEYLIKLIEKGRITAVPNKKDVWTSIFKFYSNEQTEIYKEGKLVCRLEKDSNEPYYLPVSRKGDYRFQGVNVVTGETKTIDECIDSAEEKNIIISWESSSLLQQQASKEHPAPSSHNEESKKNFLEIVKIKLLNWCNIREKTNHHEDNNSEVTEANDKSDCPIYTKDVLEDILSSLDKIIVKDGFHYSKDYDNLGLKLEVCEQNLREQGIINIPEKVEILKMDESGTGIYTKYILPVTSIGYCAFEAYPNLTKITIPKTVVEIKDGAFRYCRELRFVNIPNSVKYIGYQAFCGCSSLKSIVLPSETIEFSGGIFEACKSLQDVEFTSVAKFITADVFKGCYSLQSIIVPKGSKWKFTFVSEEEDFYLFSLLKEKEDLDIMKG